MAKQTKNNGDYKNTLAVWFTNNWGKALTILLLFGMFFLVYQKGFYFGCKRDKRTGKINKVRIRIGVKSIKTIKKKRNVK